MNYKELKEKLTEGIEILKDYSRFIMLFSDKPEGDLTRLNDTLQQIQLNLDLSELKEVLHPRRKPFEEGGKFLVSVKPCKEDKTFIGIYLGDVPRSTSLSKEGEQIQVEFSSYNPAMYVPELKRVVYGYESWWHEIESIDEFKKITKEDIENTWYAKLLRVMEGKQNDKVKEGSQI
jgi:hypothetical protein